MKKYLLREINKTGIESMDDIFAGCTKDRAENAFTRKVFEDRKEAISYLRKSEYFSTSHVVRNFFTKGCYEVTEFFVVFVEVGEYDNPVEKGMIIAFSDMPDMSNESCWVDNSQGIKEEKR